MPSFVNRVYDRFRHRTAASIADVGVSEGPFPDTEYALVGTYRRSGELVATPLWVATDGERLVFRTEHDTVKLKRIRNDPRVLVAPCDARGRPKGPPVAGTARITGLDDEAAERALDRKYGRKRRIYEKVAPYGDLVYVEITR